MNGIGNRGVNSRSGMAMAKASTADCGSGCFCKMIDDGALPQRPAT